MSINVLFVSISFPPKSDPEALQTAKYFRYLQQHKDLKISVVTSAVPTLYMPYDQDLEPYTEGVEQRIDVRLKENRYVNILFNRLGLENTFFPDNRQSFHRQYKKVVRQLKCKPDILYSRADPKSSTIMAYKLKQELNVPWILHMSDIWADCPLLQLKGSYYKKSDEWERRCVEAADLVTVTSIPTLEFYRKKYPGMFEKFRFYPNVFELEQKEEPTPPGDDKFRMVYTGGLAGERSPEFLLAPLKGMYDARPGLADEMEVIFAGATDARSRSIIQSFNLPFVKHVGLLPFREALRLQRSAHYLVVIDNPIEDPSMSVFFPSKLLDYMLARKRVIAITTAGSASDLVMRDMKGDVCSHQNKEDIKKAIEKALAAWRAGNREYLENDVPPEKYEARYNADRLYHDILNLVHV